MDPLRFVACILLARLLSLNPPAELLGRFEDDYRVVHVVTAEEWREGSRSTYHLLRWNSDRQYVLARNAASNPDAPGRFSRFDWVTFKDQGRFTWGYCQSAYDAASAEEAERAPSADRANPRTGCSGHPFTRMAPQASARAQGHPFPNYQRTTTFAPRPLGGVRNRSSSPVAG